MEENSSHIVDIIDYYPLTIDEDYDVVGFSVTTPQFPAIQKIKKSLHKEQITVLGGPHCKYYDEKGFDYIIKGDGCEPFLDILNKIPIINLPDSPNALPHRDKLLYKYKYLLDNKRTTTIMTSRGCPNSCYFCENAHTDLRLKSPVFVEREIRECVDLGFGGIMFFDDLFCLNQKRVDELCEVIKPFDIIFRGFAHARNFTEEMAETLSDAGCVELGYGAEHASQKILDTVNKRTKVQQNYDLIKTAHKFGIRVKAFLMIGLPGENHETVKDLKQFIQTSGVDDFDLTIYYPYKGTYIADHINEFDLQIESNGLGYYKGKKGSAECTIRTKALSSKEIKQYQQELYGLNKRWHS